MNKGSKWERVFPKPLTQSGHIFSSDSSGDSNLWRVDTKTNCNGGRGGGGQGILLHHTKSLATAVS